MGRMLEVKNSLTFKKRVAFQRRKCYLCAGHIPQISVDHVVPKKLGGTNEQKNLLASCLKCNVKKSCRAPFACEVFYLKVVNEATLKAA